MHSRSALGQHSGSKPVFLLAPNVEAKQAGVDPFSRISSARSPFSCSRRGPRNGRQFRTKTFGTRVLESTALEIIRNITALQIIRNMTECSFTGGHRAPDQEGRSGSQTFVNFIKS